MNELILKLAKKEGISDIHIQSGLPIGIRINGSIEKDVQTAKKDAVNKFIKDHLSAEQYKVFEREGSYDCGFSIKDKRFRANFFKNPGIWTLEQLINKKIINRYKKTCFINHFFYLQF